MNQFVQWRLYTLLKMREFEYEYLLEMCSVLCKIGCVVDQEKLNSWNFDSKYVSFGPYNIY